MPSKDHTLEFRWPHIEDRTEVEDHPTISQDWTNKETTEHKRLVALQEKKPHRSHRGRIDKSEGPDIAASSLKFAESSGSELERGPTPLRKQKHPATFQCSLCPKKFTRAYNLRSHLRTHTDERPFVCTVCGKSFARQHDLKRHEGLHVKEAKPEDKGMQVIVPTFHGENSGLLSAPSPSSESLSDKGSLGSWRSEVIITGHQDFDGMYEQNEPMRNERYTDMSGHQQRKRRRKDPKSSGSESEVAATPRKREVPASRQSDEIQALRRELEALKSEKGLLEYRTHA